MIDFLHNSCRFFAHESCGQCTPCREGTHWSLEMMERIKAGRGRLKDLELLLEIGDSIGIIPGTTICGLADGAAWPIKNAIRKFRGEFEDYIKRTNPEGYMATEPVEAMKHLTYPPLVQVRPPEPIVEPPLEKVQEPEVTAN
jgi:NADH-quinone oxidoreductase subunit F